MLRQNYQTENKSLQAHVEIQQVKSFHEIFYQALTYTYP